MTGMPWPVALVTDGLDGRPVLGEDDQDLGALRDELVDVGRLRRGARLRVVRDVLGAGRCESRLDGGLIPLGPALFRVVVPRDADLAAGCAGAARCGGRARARSSTAADVRTCGQDDRGRCHEPGQLAVHLHSSSPPMDPNDGAVWNPPALGYHPPNHGCDMCCVPVHTDQALRNCCRFAGPIQAAGSARIGSNASSAAPSSDASSARAAGTTRTSARGAARARRSSSSSTLRMTNG